VPRSYVPDKPMAPVLAESSLRSRLVAGWLRRLLTGRPNPPMRSRENILSFPKYLMIPTAHLLNQNFNFFTMVSTKLRLTKVAKIPLVGTVQTLLVRHMLRSFFKVIIT
jgi:hypothetical protein